MAKLIKLSNDNRDVYRGGFPFDPSYCIRFKPSGAFSPSNLVQSLAIYLEIGDWLKSNMMGQYINVSAFFFFEKEEDAMLFYLTHNELDV